MRFALLLVAAILPLGALAAQESQSSSTQPRQAHVFTPEHLTWGPAPAILPAGARLAVLDGDPSKAGPYTMRLSMPAGYRIPPHFHQADEHVAALRPRRQGHGNSVARRGTLGADLRQSGRSTERRK